MKNNPSKLQSEAVLEFDKKIPFILSNTKANDRGQNEAHLQEEKISELKQFLSDQIQKAVDEGYQLGFSNGMKSVASALGYKKLSIQSKEK